jgi:protein ImuB
LDTHAPEAFRLESFRIDAFRVTEGDAETTDATELRAAARQLRPAEIVTVTLEAQRPERFSFREQGFKVDRAYGPWLAGGDWWQPTLWGHEQWDIVARASDNSLLCCCLVRDRMHGGWQMAALYD